MKGYYMNGQELAQALRKGQRVYGTLIVSPSPKWLEYVPKLGLDYVFIDLEHIPLDRQTVSWMCQAYASRGLPPLVRILKPDPDLACAVLDGGAAGVVAPYVEKVEQVQALRGAVKLRPLKGQRLTEALSGSHVCESELQEYQDTHNNNHLLILNIESKPALDNLSDMLMVPGLDAVLIGPHDLSSSLGIPEQYFHPMFEQAVETIIDKARTRNIGVGFHTTYPQGLKQEIRWIHRGMNMVLHLADIISFCAKMEDDIQQIKTAVGDYVETQRDKLINI